jgi:hypothetical protein
MNFILSYSSLESINNLVRNHTRAQIAILQQMTMYMYQPGRNIDETKQQPTIATLNDDE